MEKAKDDDFGKKGNGENVASRSARIATFSLAKGFSVARK
jgi:hypothetical protein